MAIEIEAGAGAEVEREVFLSVRAKTFGTEENAIHMARKIRDELQVKFGEMVEVRVDGVRPGWGVMH